MKRALAIVILALAASATAGAWTGTRTKAVVPFAFTVGQKGFDAGAYTFERNSQNGLLAVRDERGGRVLVLTNSNGDASKGPGRLVFRRSGNHWTLDQVQMAGSTSHVVAAESDEDFAIAFTWR